MKNFVIIVALGLSIVLTSCKTVGKTSSSYQKSEVKDSVVYVEKQVAVPYYVQGDTVTLSVPVNCDSLNQIVPFKAQSNGKRAAVSVYAEKGYLTLMSYFKGYTDSVYRKDTYVKELQTRFDSLAHIQSEVKAVPYIPKAYQYAMWYTVGSLILLVIYIIFRILKLYFKWNLPI